MNAISEWGFPFVTKDTVGTTGEIKIWCADQKTDYINIHFKMLILITVKDSLFVFKKQSS